MTIRLAVIAVVLTVLFFAFFVRVWIRIGGGRAIFHWSPPAWEHELSRTDIDHKDEDSSAVSKTAQEK
jgi:hypothetical protein